MRRVGIVLREKSILLGLFVACVYVQLAGAFSISEMDAQYHAWPFRRTIQVSAHSDSEVAVSLPIDVLLKTQPDGRDLRLVSLASPSGRFLLQTPYRIEQVTRNDRLAATGRIVKTESTTEQTTVVWVDAGHVQSVDAVVLHIPSQAFAKKISIEAAEDKQMPYRRVVTGAVLFHQVLSGDNSVHFRKEEIVFPTRVKARFFRFIMDDKESSPLVIEKVSFRRWQVTNHMRWTREVSSVRVTDPSYGPDRVGYRFDVQDPLPFDTVRVILPEGRPFIHHARLFALIPQGKRGAVEKKQIAETLLYRCDAQHPPEIGGTSVPSATPDSSHNENGALPVPQSLEATISSSPSDPFWVEGEEFSLSTPTKATSFLLEVDHPGEASFPDPLISLHGPSKRIWFYTQVGQQGFLLYYGNPKASAFQCSQTIEGPVDLQRDSFNPSRVVLAEEKNNPLFQENIPLPARATKLDLLDTRAFLYVQAVRPVQHSGMYTLSLSPESMKLLRTDWADLRVVDENRREIPYLLTGCPSSSNFSIRWTAIEKDDPAWGYRIRKASIEDRGAMQSIEFDVENNDVDRTLMFEAVVGVGEGQRTIVPLTAIRVPQTTIEHPRIHLRVQWPELPEHWTELRIKTDQKGTMMSMTDPKGSSIDIALSFQGESAHSYSLLLGQPQQAAPTYETKMLSGMMVTYPSIQVELLPVTKNPEYAEQRDRRKEKFPLIAAGGIAIAIVAVAIFWRRKKSRLSITE